MPSRNQISFLRTKNEPEILDLKLTDLFLLHKIFKVSLWLRPTVNENSEENCIWWKTITSSQNNTAFGFVHLFFLASLPYPILTTNTGSFFLPLWIYSQFDLETQFNWYKQYCMLAEEKPSKEGRRWAVIWHRQNC